ncbi:hypothetical protein ARMSODRAFT_965320 [Armillaria solidipes]|uniref:Uncharacterized protein n=1 Tax=Armillaria solidipes TaxID=1076256 RepID=A0A2H3BAU4_9AGAR|nr:hypothetical protein ARMSODRAFT_965320 [Armillaria solidipes]
MHATEALSLVNVMGNFEFWIRSPARVVAPHQQDGRKGDVDSIGIGIGIGTGTVLCCYIVGWARKSLNPILGLQIPSRT